MRSHVREPGEAVACDRKTGFLEGQKLWAPGLCALDRDFYEAFGNCTEGFFQDEFQDELIKNSEFSEKMLF